MKDENLHEMITTEITNESVCISLIPERAYALQRILTDAGIPWFSWNQGECYEESTWISQEYL